MAFNTVNFACLGWRVREGPCLAQLTSITLWQGKRWTRVCQRRKQQQAGGNQGTQRARWGAASTSQAAESNAAALQVNH